MTLTPQQWKALGWSLAAIVVVIIILLAVFLHKRNQSSTPPPPQQEESAASQRQQQAQQQLQQQQGSFRPIPSYAPHELDDLSPMPQWISAPPRPGESLTEVPSKHPDSIHSRAPAYH